MASLRHHWHLGAPPLLLLALTLILSPSCPFALAEESTPFSPASDDGVHLGYETAVQRTREMLARGLIDRDPATLSPRGSLLDEPYPHHEHAFDEEDWALGEHESIERGLWRRSLGSRAFYSLGVSLNSNSGTSLSDINSTYFRYASVTPLSLVDWRTSAAMTPIQRQYSCASCWAMAAVDSVAILTAIVNNTVGVPLSAQQVCDCAGDGTCCDGGWPEDAYAYILSNGNITSDSAYPYIADDSPTCNSNSSLPSMAKISGWEQVPAYDQLSLMKAVTVQPVLVFISSGSFDFQTYSSYGRINVYNGNCSNEVNHAMLAVGYNLTGGYWILKNSWPRTWGDGGYMYIAMQEGTGKCGMLTTSPFYPVYYPLSPQQAKVKKGSKFPVPSDNSNGGKWWSSWVKPSSSSSYSACSGLLRPCGAGTCTTDFSTGIARCSCPPGYVELVGVPTSKCISATPCSALINPCGSGTCNDAQRDGTYTCTCTASAGFVLGSSATGAPTCIPVSSSAVSTYVTQYGDNCTRIQRAYNMSSATFTSLNPFVDCTTATLLPGLVVSITNFVCTRTYTVQAGDSCSAAANNIGISTSTLTALNPLLNCSSMYTGQLLCVSSSTSSLSTAAFSGTCGVANLTVFGSTDSCANFVNFFNTKANPFSISDLTRLNPGLDCSNATKQLPTGISLCRAAGNTSAPTCTKVVRVQQGDTCPLIWNSYNLTQAVFFSLNPGIRCQAPFLQVGQQVCVESPTSADLVANQTTRLIRYLVQTGDTLSYIAGLFTSRCTSTSVSVSTICSQNQIAFDAVPVAGSILTIPCVPKIGAGCGCAQSIAVCGADSVTYSLGYCDAQCNYALPVISSTNPCDSCQNACKNRAGLTPNPTSACPANTVCPYPVWSPPCADASQLIASNQAQCLYMSTTCDNLCKAQSSLLGGDSTTMTTNYNNCYRNCYCCARAPCGGPACEMPRTARMPQPLSCNTSPNCTLSSGVCTVLSAKPPCLDCSIDGTTWRCYAACSLMPPPFVNNNCALATPSMPMG